MWGLCSQTSGQLVRTSVRNWPGYQRCRSRTAAVSMTTSPTEYPFLRISFRTDESSGQFDSRQTFRAAPCSSFSVPERWRGPRRNLKRNGGSPLRLTPQRVPLRPLRTGSHRFRARRLGETCASHESPLRRGGFWTVSSLDLFLCHTFFGVKGPGSRDSSAGVRWRKAMGGGGPHFPRLKALSAQDDREPGSPVEGLVSARCCAGSWPFARRAGR